MTNWSPPLDSIPKKTNHVVTNVLPVKLLLLANVLPVVKIEKNQKINVHVLKVTMKMLMMYVNLVDINVKLVKPKMTNVSLVMVTELTHQNVNAQLIILILKKKHVQVAQILVNLVTKMEFVLNVKITEIQSLNVNVLLIILKLLSKINFSVKFVMSDVKNVTKFTTCVKIVPKIL